MCSYLGEALRALLVLEVRQLRLAGRHPCERTPAHLPQGATASRCSVQTASGAHATVVLGGPPNGMSQIPDQPATLCCWCLPIRANTMCALLKNTTSWERTPTQRNSM